MQLNSKLLSTPKSTVKNILCIGALGVGLAACNSSGSSGVDDTLNVTNNSNQQVAGLPQPDKIQDPRAYCPKTVLRAGTETYNVYPDGIKDGDEGASSQLLYRSTIGQIARECNRAGPNINIKVGVRGRLLTGPRGQPGSFNMPIRVAVTRGDEVLYSQLHQVPAVIDPGKTVGAFSYVDGNISFPIPENENVIIYVGYDEGPYDTE